MNSYTDPMDHTADEWEAKSRGQEDERAASWERSDTDGFLSQWASQQMASRYRTLAQVVRNGGTWDLCYLADAEGNVIEGARQVETKYGLSWVYDGPTGTVWFRESSHSNPDTAKARDLAKGHQVVYRATPVVMDRAGRLIPKD